MFWDEHRTAVHGLSTGDQNVAKLNRVLATLLAVVIVPVAYFMGVSEQGTPSIYMVFSLVVGGYVGCLLVAFAIVKILGSWLPDDG